MKKPRLTVINPDPTAAEPSRPLGQAGRTMWDYFTRAYDFNDVAGSEIMCTICEARDTISRLEAEIATDGDVIRTRGGHVKAHPAQRDLLANRAFIIRTLDRLGLNSEAVRQASGRPSRGY